MSVELLGTAVPIYMVGESHCLAFSDLLFRREDAQTAYLCRTRFIPKLKAADYSVEQDISSDLVKALQASEIVDDLLRPAFLHAEPASAFLSGLPCLSPPLVLFAGDLDLHKLFQQFGDEFDFLLPEDPYFGVDQAKQNVPYADVVEQIVEFLTPFFGAVRSLQDVGFNRIMVHCLPPRTPDSAMAARWTSGVEIGVPLRAKLTMAANRLMHDFCIELGSAFIDTWPELAEQGLLRPEFELDGAHTNRAAALVSVDTISECLVDHTAQIWNSTRYRFASSQADHRAASAAHAELERQWSDFGFIRSNMGGDLAARALKDVSFDIEGLNPHARPDWVGWPRNGRPGTVLGEPSDALLGFAKGMLGSGEAQALLQAGSNRKLTVCSFRPVSYAADACESETLPSPIGTRRAVIFLSATNRLTLETTDGQPLTDTEYEAGDTLIYDPQRVRLRLSSGAESAEVVELALMPRLSGQPFRVVWAGLCDWPADPYLHSVVGMKASPSFSGQIYRQRSKW